MKNTYLLILLCATLFACKEQKSEQKEVVTEVEAPKQWLNYEGSSDDSKHIVLISGDEEYRSEEALPQLAKILSKHHGFKCTVLFAQDPAKPGIVNSNYVNNIPGLDALDSADMMVILTRFRALPDDQMQHIDDYLKSGKPVVGLRTATHAFNFKEEDVSLFKNYGNYYKGDLAEWTDGFGRLVLGENWQTHHGHHKHQSTRGVFAKGAEAHPITNGIVSGEIWGPTDVYGVRLPLPDDSAPIILGQIINRAGEYNEDDVLFGMKSSDTELATENNTGLKVNDVLMPISWTKSYQLPGGKKGKAFTSTIGAATDMLNESVRRLIVNSVFWTMGETVPEKANVDLVGDFKPSAYGFQTNEYWLDKNLKISDLE
ncbi:ThuA domain-containing protein [Aurantibacter crassamenti]|uniref:ThuA domain-containing protein n=1 Tax=Aurantibacter crassamenti TaxID=1837375 RepID=UPI001939EFE8|nr:ThuA domain-containing protein [Aurantibacter crassamenti]MBM1105730.1 ThuA domain-containing protein [Aurantibacter crassamenti]